VMLAISKLVTAVAVWRSAMWVPKARAVGADPPSGNDISYSNTATPYRAGNIVLLSVSSNLQWYFTVMQSCSKGCRHVLLCLPTTFIEDVVPFQQSVYLCMLRFDKAQVSFQAQNLTRESSVLLICSSRYTARTYWPRMTSARGRGRRTFSRKPLGRLLDQLRRIHSPRSELALLCT
jgi:hypothetical protein